MDLSKLNTRKASDTSKQMKLRNPFTNDYVEDDDGNVVTIDVLGIQSHAAKNALAEQSRKQKPDMSDEDKDKIGAEMLAKLVTGWSNNIHLGDELLEFSYANAARLFVQEEWIAQQVFEFARKLRNYDPNA